MKCKYCGSEIEEGVKFCTNCGVKVEPEEVKPTPQPEPVVVEETEPQPEVKPTPPPKQGKSAPQFNPQPSQACQPEKKKNNGLVILLIVVAVIVVLFAGCLVIGGLTAKKTVDTIVEEDDYFDDVDDVDDDDIFDSYMYGGLYKDGKLQYGPAVIDLPDYTLYEYTEDGEDEPSDWYLVDNADNVQSIVYVLQQYEYNVSCTNTSEEDIKNSYTEEDGWTNVKMLSFEKTKVGDHPCIIYSASATNNGTDEYILECIIFDEDNADETVRILGECGSEDAYKKLLEKFENVKLASTPVTYDDTESFTWKHITQK